MLSIRHGFSVARIWAMQSRIFILTIVVQRNQGSSIVTEWNTKAGQAIHIINNDTLLHTSNYKLNFKNCYIDGKLITSESDFKPQYKDSNELTISINNDGTKPEYPLYCVRNK